MANIFIFLDPYVLSIRTAFVSGWCHDSKSSFPTDNPHNFQEKEVYDCCFINRYCMNFRCESALLLPRPWDPFFLCSCSTLMCSHNGRINHNNRTIDYSSLKTSNYLLHYSQWCEEENQKIISKKLSNYLCIIPFSDQRLSEYIRYANFHSPLVIFSTDSLSWEQTLSHQEILYIPSPDDVSVANMFV